MSTGPLFNEKGGGLQATLGILNKKHWSFSAMFFGMDLDPGNLPADFQEGTGVVLFFPYSTEILYSPKVISVNAGRWFPIGKRSWFTSEIGVSYVHGQKYRFKRNPLYTGEPVFTLLGFDYPSNYDFSFESKNTIGVLVKLDYNLPVGKRLGFSLGAVASLNDIQSFLATQGSLIFRFGKKTVK